MKYIVYILFIACIATLSSLFSSGSKSEEKEYAVRVDGRIISTAEISKLKQQSPSLFSQSDELPQSLVMREVLINEAIRQRVDQEEAFRQRIKTFYEQSLVKILVERQMDSIRYAPTAKELAAYANLIGRKIDLTLVPLDSTGQPFSKDIEHLSGPFLDFSLEIRMHILFLKPSVTSRPVSLFDQTYVLVVNEISDKAQGTVNQDEKHDYAVIQEYRRQELFAKWQEKLLKQADIVIAPKQGEQGS